MPHTDNFSVVPSLPGLYDGRVMIAHSGKEYVVKGRPGSVNVKGFLIEDGVVTDKVYVVPRRAIKDTRDLTTAENDARLGTMKDALNFRAGVVVSFKNPPKGFTTSDRFVVIKEATDGTSFSVVPLGGDDQRRYWRNVTSTMVNLVNL